MSRYAPSIAGLQVKSYEDQLKWLGDQVEQTRKVLKRPVLPHRGLLEQYLLMLLSLAESVKAARDHEDCMNERKI